MTVDEFKIKHPELSHLEGNELWNAMEDSYLIEHKKDAHKEITDWKGNVIKDGDEICFIKILDKQMFRFMGLVLGNETFGEPEPEREPTECWEVGDYRKVEMRNNIPYITYKSGEYTFVTPISMSLFTMDKETTILAIKGISDFK